MKINILNKKEKLVKVTEDFSKNLIDIIQELCLYKVKTDISEKIKELNIKEEAINIKLERYNRLLTESINIESLIKNQENKLVQENKNKVNKLLEILNKIS